MKSSEPPSIERVMHKLIAQSGGWQDPDDAQKAVRGQLAKKEQFRAVQIANIPKAIAEGRALRSLLATLEKLETEQEAVCQELEKTEAEIEQATVKRPTAEQVQQVWSQIVELWEKATEEERQMLFGSIVRRVEVKEKDLVYLELSPIADIRGPMFEINSQMGAGIVVVKNYPPILIPDFVVSKPVRQSGRNV